jgi:transcriptional regulator with XRE-family HTH domain
MHLGTQIKIARISAGLTQQDLADKVHKTRPLISSIEQTGRVNDVTLKKICQVLDLDINELKTANNVIVNQFVSAKQRFEELQRENINLKLEIASLKDLVDTQKDLIELLKQSIKKK